MACGATLGSRAADATRSVALRRQGSARYRGVCCVEDTEATLHLTLHSQGLLESLEIPLHFMQDN